MIDLMDPKLFNYVFISGELPGQGKTLLLILPCGSELYLAIKYS